MPNIKFPSSNYRYFSINVYKSKYMIIGVQSRAGYNCVPKGRSCLAGVMAAKLGQDFDKYERDIQ